MTPRITCSCSSDSRRTSNGEVALQVPGLEGLEKPPVLVFSTVQVCLNCGFAAFVVQDGDLRNLRENYRSVTAFRQRIAS
jgi:hypothetical protein